MKDSEVLLMGGSDSTHHNFDRLLPILHKLLENIELDVTISDNPDMFLPDNIQRFHIIVCYTSGHTLNPDQEKGLFEAIKGNPWNELARTKGCIGTHGASCSFLNSEAYLWMLGGKFLVHPPMDTIHSEITNPDHPVTRGVTNFSIEDELYLVETYSPYEPLVICNYDDFQRPLVRVKPYGLGKVMYISLGHGEKPLKNKTFQQILINAINWILDE
jgi:type 1 glutamine amidotransferase